MKMDLTQMAQGASGEIVGLNGGAGMMKRVQAMGIKPGSRIKKISSHFWYGPQTIQVGSAKIAIGFGMAKKIIVRVKK